MSHIKINNSRESLEEYLGLGLIEFAGNGSEGVIMEALGFGDGNDLNRGGTRDVTYSGDCLADKQKENAAKALELIAQSKTDGDPDEGRPESAEELENYEWITTDGHLGVMFDGLPRYLA